MSSLCRSTLLAMTHGFNVIGRPAHLLHAGRGNLSDGHKAPLAAGEAPTNDIIVISSSSTAPGGMYESRNDMRIEVKLTYKIAFGGIIIYRGTVFADWSIYDNCNDCPPTK